MNKVIIVYVCNDEFNYFKCGWIDRKRSGDNTYVMRNDQNAWFFVVQDKNGVNVVKKGVKKLFIGYSDNKLKEEPNEQELAEGIRKYLEVFFDVLGNHFVTVELPSYSVYVITHWGGGSPESIDKMEECIQAAVDSLSNTDKRFIGWKLLSASETMRPKLFSDRFSTVVARKNEGKAELPDAEECEKILERHKRKEYGSGCVDWCERDPKKLYDDLMEHLNH